MGIEAGLELGFPVALVVRRVSRLARQSSSTAFPGGEE